MQFFAELTDPPGALGGKAAGLLRLAGAGCAVPVAFVITHDLFQWLRAGAPALPGELNVSALQALEEAATQLRLAPWPPGFVTELQERLAALAGAPAEETRFSVRSSFWGEDGRNELERKKNDPGLAAGVYQSRVDLGAHEVESAIREVLVSAISAGALAYATAQGRPLAAPPVAVLVHPFIAGPSQGIAASDGQSPLLIAEQGMPLSPSLRGVLAEVLRRLVAYHGPSEVEWTAQPRAGLPPASTFTFLQLRPYYPPRPLLAWPPLRALPVEEIAAWRWDVSHNPTPLSPAQAGLVEWVDAHCQIGIRQRVLGGYLFFCPGGPPPSPPLAPTDTAAAFATLVTRFETALAAMKGRPTLAEALTLFAAIYQPLLGAIGPASQRGVADLTTFLQRTCPLAAPEVPRLLSDLPSRAQERHRLAEQWGAAVTPEQLAQARAAYLDPFGDESPAWDVAVPTWRESLQEGPSAAVVVSWPWQDLAGRIRQQLAAADQLAWDAILTHARARAVVRENDDWLYARLQAVVRHALLRLGQRLTDRGDLDFADQIFWIPLARARDLDATPDAPAPELRQLVATGRDSYRAAVTSPPPLPGRPPAGPIVRGVGTGGRALGLVVIQGGPLPVTPDSILVARTLLPTQLPLLHPLAFVVETGGPLDHVAAQARERRLPAVVGAAGAMALLQDGDLVLVDADAGLVIPMRRASGKRPPAKL